MEKVKLFSPKLQPQKISKLPLETIKENPHNAYTSKHNGFKIFNIFISCNCRVIIFPFPEEVLRELAHVFNVSLTFSSRSMIIFKIITQIFYLYTKKNIATV